MSEELFTVWLISPDDWWVKAAEGLPARLAVDYACWMTRTQEARVDEIQRIIIADEGNHKVFEWKFGEGVTFRTSEMERLPCLAPSVLRWLEAGCRHVRALLRFW